MSSFSSQYDTSIHSRSLIIPTITTQSYPELSTPTPSPSPLHFPIQTFTNFSINPSSTNLGASLNALLYSFAVFNSNVTSPAVFSVPPYIRSKCPINLIAGFLSGSPPFFSYSRSLCSQSVTGTVANERPEWARAGRSDVVQEKMLGLRML